MKTYITISKKYKLHFFDVFLISWIIANLIVLILSKRDTSVHVTDWNSSLFVNYCFENFFYFAIIPLLTRFFVSNYFSFFYENKENYLNSKDLALKYTILNEKEKLKLFMYIFLRYFILFLRLIFVLINLILLFILPIFCIVLLFVIGVSINTHYWSDPHILAYIILYILLVIILITFFLMMLNNQQSRKIKKIERKNKILQKKLGEIDEKKATSNSKNNIKDELQNKIESYLYKYAYFINNSKSYPVKNVDWDELNNEQIKLELSDEIVLEVKWYYLKNLKRKYCNWFVFSSIGACFFSPLNDKMPILTIIIASIGMIYCFYFNYTLYDHKWSFVKIKHVKYKFIPLLYIIIVSTISIAYSKSELHKTIEEIHTVILSLIGILAMILSFFS